MLGQVTRRLWLLATCAVGASGCGSQLQLMDRGPTSGISPCSFWPPPPSTSIELIQSHPLPQKSLATIATRVSAELQAARHPEPRWYPIGLGYTPGFAATTRLEALNADATPLGSPERWSPLYPDAANLPWLAQARGTPLSRDGRYRVLLIAVTDLPVAPSTLAPVWNEDTVM